MEIRINPNQVSHIAICDGHKGYKWSNCIQEFEYRKFKKYWLWRTNPDGYYSVKGWNNYFRELPEGCFTLGGNLWSYASVSIFSGEKRIKNRYFENIRIAKEWVTQNFPNCNVIIE